MKKTNKFSVKKIEKAHNVLLKEALPKAIIESVIEEVPILGWVKKVVDKTSDKIKEGCLLKFIYAMYEDIDMLKGKFNPKWLNTLEGNHYCIKVVSTATNGENIEKIDYFAHANINASHGLVSTPLVTKYKFVDILKNLSLLDLKILARFKKYVEPNALENGYRQVEIGDVLPSLADEYSTGIIEASFINLVNNGVLSRISSWDKTVTPRGNKYEAAEKLGDYDGAYYTHFTMEFVKFITQHK